MVRKKIKGMKYFSMFSGIGGFRYGIEQTENNRQIWKSEKRLWDGKKSVRPKRIVSSSISSDGDGRRIHTSCVGYSEIDKYATAIYDYQYPGTKNFGDATTINVSKLPNFDLLIAGFPCQAFSIAGKRKGFNDTRGTLFFEIARVLRDKRPRYFLLENVKGLLSHDNGKTFTTILRVLTDIGYEYQWQVFNSKDFAVPHNRERVFIIGHIRGERKPKIFPIGESNTINEKIQSGQEGYGARASCLSVRYGQRWTDETYVKENGLKYVDYSNNLYPEGKIYKENGISKTIDIHRTGNYGNYEINDKIRKLTPIECERLQGFPDNWTKYGIINGEKVKISDSQRYKCCGNAVTTNVITVIIEKLFQKKKIRIEKEPCEVNCKYVKRNKKRINYIIYNSELSLF